MPFGEYIPMRDLMTKFIGRLALIPRDFLPGTEPGVLDVGGTRIGDVICFEVAFDGLVRDTVRDGGKLLIVQTNNATYGHTGQPEQQLAISRIRAIEHGRAMVIAATSGISGVIRADGSVADADRRVHPARDRAPRCRCAGRRRWPPGSVPGSSSRCARRSLC